jgi:hypothetical protein
LQARSPLKVLTLDALLLSPTGSLNLFLERCLPRLLFRGSGNENVSATRKRAIEKLKRTVNLVSSGKMACQGGGRLYHLIADDDAITMLNAISPTLEFLDRQIRSDRRMA